MINILVGQSGGPSSVINSTLAGVLKAASERDDIKVFGAFNGIDGVINSSITDLTPYQDEKSLALLKQTPAMSLGSCRVKLPEDLNHPVYKRICKTLSDYSISYLFYIGGNDSMDTVEKLTKYFEKEKLNIKAIGLPKTIDNDLCLTDHTPGFGSTAKYLSQTISGIICDSNIYPVKNVVIVEIMGRNSGWLTLASALPRFLGGNAPHIIALPETPFNENKFIDEIQTKLESINTVIAVVSEGIKDCNGEYIGSNTKSGAVDNFGHTYLSGVGKYLERLVSHKIGCKVRSIELNVLQRCCEPSLSDSTEAFEIGRRGVHISLEKQLSGQAFVFKRVYCSDNPYNYGYEIEYADIAQIANKEKKVPQEWLDVYNPTVWDEIKRYIMPLIAGDMPVIKDENGMPQYLIINNHIM